MAGGHALLLTSALLLALARADDGWVAARATWFDVGPDMSTANCHYSSAPTGRYVGAWPDHQDGFDASCGKCFEVSCRNADFQDGYGETLSRSNVCYDPSKSVVITIVDACPCSYPNNAYSNQRWCCGDAEHIDLSQEAFEQLADLSQGAIGIFFRQVSCSTSGSPGNGGGGAYSSGGGSGQVQQPQTSAGWGGFLRWGR
ncbi:Expansin-A15 [Tetrabaena socialis]|uniref:Expansin-A15 n=1 Tax=Tetrabaena socialis TaxID=47790 RepID=A0A2J8AJL5_9CHLO|nr:Expansin-A15 [Tetrabaena socialis]|eukprot:PNH12715.1 Expansin-A15 [Tetrabaena socialis]